MRKYGVGSRVTELKEGGRVKEQRVDIGYEKYSGMSEKEYVLKGLQTYFKVFWSVMSGSQGNL